MSDKMSDPNIENLRGWLADYAGGEQDLATIAIDLTIDGMPAYTPRQLAPILRARGWISRAAGGKYLWRKPGQLTRGMARQSDLERVATICVDLIPALSEPADNPGHARIFFGRLQDAYTDIAGAANNALVAAWLTRWVARRGGRETHDPTRAGERRHQRGFVYQVDVTQVDMTPNVTPSAGTK